MKKFLLSALALTFIVVGCKKEDAIQPVQKNQTRKIEVCTFGLKDNEFNLTKRNIDATAEAIALQKMIRDAKGKGPKPKPGGDTVVVLTPPPVDSTWTVFLDFDGQTVDDPNWYNQVAYGQPIQASPSGLTADQQLAVLTRVQEAYANFKVNITTDSTVYWKAVSIRRLRVVLTQSWEWYGSKAGGVAYINSFDWMNPVCWVFSGLLNFNAHNIAEATAHEIGHCIGLWHQVVYNGCTFAGEYNYGPGDGTAPIMGCSYNVSAGSWWNGYIHASDTYGCPTTKQDDYTIIFNRFGLKP